MITLIGTGHVFSLSTGILKIFDEKNPDVICVELDKQRYSALMMKQTDPEKYHQMSKNSPIIYKMLARFQDNMANEYGVVAGDEMLTAIKYAQGHQLPLAFIDMNAQVMFSKMLKSMSFSEKFKLFLTGVSGFFISKKRVEKELAKYEKNLDSYLHEIGNKFPTIKRVLIDERNTYMVQQLVKANEQHEKVVALVGDGHIIGLSELLNEKEAKFETIRLSDLQKMQNVESDSSTASFSLEYKDSL